MGIYAIKPLFQKKLEPIKQLCLRLQISPTTLNVLGVLTSLVVALCIAFSARWTWLLLMIPVGAFVRTALNALDGLVARELAVSSAMGEVLNEFLDRVSDALIFSSFIFITSLTPWLAVSTVSLVLLVSYVGILSKSAGGPRMYAGMMGKADRMFFLGAFALVKYFIPALPWDWLCLFLSLALIATLVERLWRINGLLAKK